jgi:tRNA(Ile)-lysidine synthase
MEAPAEMPGPDPAVAVTRLAVREHLLDLPPGALVLVACSGGPDSVALAGALAFEAPRVGMRAGAVVVDHGLQEGSDRVADHAADVCRGMGLEPVEVVRVDVQPSGSGLEADARTARYAAFEQVASRLGAEVVLIGHTRDDQAEQVLLGLSRGSGARSLSGMPARRGRFVRPLLALPRATTLAACAAYGIEPWEDPQNADDSFRRVRARRLLATLEADLGPGFGAALARSADLLREDADYLETLAAASTSRRSPRCRGPCARACGGCSPPRPGHRSPTSPPRTSSRSTRCSPRGTVRARCTCPGASPWRASGGPSASPSSTRRAEPRQAEPDGLPCGPGREDCGRRASHVGARGGR